MSQTTLSNVFYEPSSFPNGLLVLKSASARKATCIDLVDGSSSYNFPSTLMGGKHWDRLPCKPIPQPEERWQSSSKVVEVIETRIVLEAVREVDGDDVDAIVQCGTNLSTVDLFPTLEHQLEKPLIPINVATAWHALRACGIDDKVTGKGRLLEEF